MQISGRIICLRDDIRNPDISNTKKESLKALQRCSIKL
jgi:hypothetical protein